MSVKDVLQSLVDDSMVDCERVGTSNYYWAFPSKALHARKRRLDELEKQVPPRARSGATPRLDAFRELAEPLPPDVTPRRLPRARRAASS